MAAVPAPQPLPHLTAATSACRRPQNGEARTAAAGLASAHASRGSWARRACSAGCPAAGRDGSRTGIPCHCVAACYSGSHCPAAGWCASHAPEASGRRGCAARQRTCGRAGVSLGAGPLAAAARPGSRHSQRCPWRLSSSTSSSSRQRSPHPPQQPPRQPAGGRPASLNPAGAAGAAATARGTAQPGQPAAPAAGRLGVRPASTAAQQPAG